MELYELLKIPRGVTAIVGGGGKTTLMYTLAEELRSRGRTIVCTTTHIRVPERYPLVTGPSADTVAAALERAGVVCVGTPCEDGKLTAPGLDMAALEALADVVLVEADGSRGLPLKAHAEHEPVIPAKAARVILILGADGFGRPIREVCHRPALYARLAGAEDTELVTPELAARVIAAEGLGDMLFVNKVGSDAALLAARELSACVPMPAAAGSLHRGVYTCLC